MANFPNIPEGPSHDANGNITVQWRKFHKEMQRIMADLDSRLKALETP